MLPSAARRPPWRSARAHVRPVRSDPKREDGTAYFIYGLTFRFDASVDAGVRPGGYVRLDTDGSNAHPGQVIDIDARLTGAGQPAIIGSGLIRCRAEGSEAASGPATAFGSARFAPAAPELVRSYFALMQGRKVGLDIGALLQVPGGLLARLLAAGFGRHTPMRGQSGCGKTCTLGVILERLLLVTWRPQRLHVNVLSQCGSLVLMGMRSGGDINHLATLFSHVPASPTRPTACSPSERPRRRRCRSWVPHAGAARLGHTHATLDAAQADDRHTGHGRERRPSPACCDRKNAASKSRRAAARLLHPQQSGAAPGDGIADLKVPSRADKEEEGRPILRLIQIFAKEGWCGREDSNFHSG